jgi:hypothetical protein
MNPKTINDLDPKLKETYERVMGTSFGPQAPTSTSQPAQATIAVEQPVVPQPQKSAPEMVPSPQSTKPAASVPEMTIPSTSVFIQNATKTQKKSSKRLLFIVGGVIFFIAYIVVWAKIFGLF